MNIDTEKLISLDAARRLTWLPRVYAFTTVLGWTRDGLRAVRLESRQVAGTVCTSEEAMRRFFQALTELPPPPAPAKGRKADIERANAVLDRAGIK